MSKTKSVKKPTVNEGENVSKPIGSGAIRKFQIVLFALYQFANNGLVSGRTGGDVKMRNGRSRGMKIPALVRNSYTTRSRSILSTLSTMFRSLTIDQIKAWNNYEVKTSDRFGVIHNYKGKTAFVRLNANLAYIGRPAESLPPSPTATAPDSVPLNAPVIVPNTSITLHYVTTTVGAPTALIYATRALSAGISRPSKSAFRLIGTFDPNSGTSVAITTEYEAKFGAGSYNSDGKLFFQVRSIEQDNGLSSALTQVDAVIP